MNTVLKKRYFHLDLAKQPGDMDSAINRLVHFPGITAVELKGYRLQVQYDLATVSFDIVREHIAGLLPLLPVSEMKKSWICFTETNERDNLSSPAGWEHHLQDYYLSAHR